MPQILEARRICGGSLSDNLLESGRDVSLASGPEKAWKGECLPNEVKRSEHDGGYSVYGQGYYI
jgi:hypothetical protein